MKIGSWVLFTDGDNRSFGKIIEFLTEEDKEGVFHVITENFETRIILASEILEEVEEEHVYEYLSSKFLALSKFIALLKKATSENKEESLEAQEYIGKAIAVPLQQGFLDSDIIEDIFQVETKLFED